METVGLFEYLYTYYSKYTVYIQYLLGVSLAAFTLVRAGIDGKNAAKLLLLLSEIHLIVLLRWPFFEEKFTF